MRTSHFEKWRCLPASARFAHVGGSWFREHKTKYLIEKNFLTSFQQFHFHLTIQLYLHRQTAWTGRVRKGFRIYEKSQSFYWYPISIYLIQEFWRGSAIRADSDLDWDKQHFYISYCSISYHKIAKAFHNWKTCFNFLLFFTQIISTILVICQTGPSTATSGMLPNRTLYDLGVSTDPSQVTGFSLLFFSHVNLNSSQVIIWQIFYFDKFFPLQFALRFSHNLMLLQMGLLAILTEPHPRRTSKSLGIQAQLEAAARHLSHLLSEKQRGLQE